MNSWFLAQTLFAIVVWAFAARAIVRAGSLAGSTSKGLASTVRELRALGRMQEIPALSARLGVSALDPLLHDPSDDAPAEELVLRAQSVLTLAAPPVRLLRGLATMGTTLGLLAAVATLRGAIEGPAVGMEAAAARAFDSAVAGFTTALPCWTAIAMCRRDMARVNRALDLVILAMRSDDVPVAANGNGPADPVDGPDTNQ